MSAQLLSLRISSLHLSFSPGLSGSLSLGISLCACSCLGLRFLAPHAPPPAQAPPIPAARAWRSTLPLVRPEPPAPACPAPLRAPPFTQSLAPALRREGAARPGPALPRPARPRPRPLDKPLSDPSSGFKSPGPARRTALLLTPVRPVSPSVPLPRGPSKGPLHLGPKVRPWP